MAQGNVKRANKNLTTAKKHHISARKVKQLIQLTKSLIFSNNFIRNNAACW